jgi:hypothetical protein
MAKWIHEERPNNQVPNELQNEIHTKRREANCTKCLVWIDCPLKKIALDNGEGGNAQHTVHDVVGSSSW